MDTVVLELFLYDAKLTLNSQMIGARGGPLIRNMILFLTVPKTIKFPQNWIFFSLGFRNYLIQILLLTVFLSRNEQLIEKI